MNTNDIKAGQLPDVIRIDSVRHERSQVPSTQTGEATGAEKANSITQRDPDPRLSQLVDAMDALQPSRPDMVAKAQAKLAAGEYDSRQSAIDTARAILGE